MTAKCYPMDPTDSEPQYHKMSTCPTIIFNLWMNCHQFCISTQHEDWRGATDAVVDTCAIGNLFSCRKFLWYLNPVALVHFSPQSYESFWSLIIEQPQLEE